MVWDRNTGEPIHNAIVWQDRRAESICTGLAGSAAAVAAKTGLVLDPYFSAPKMAWIREHLTRDGVVTTTDTWLLHRLCGAFVTDFSTASRSLLLDLDATDVEVYGRKKRGVAYNRQGQRVGRPHVAAWAETEIVLAADLGSGTDDPRATAPELLRRALAALEAWG